MLAPSIHCSRRQAMSCQSFRRRVVQQKIFDRDLSKMNMSAYIFSLVLLLSASLSFADKEMLVLLDNLAIRETHSIFFKSLIGKNILYCYAGVIKPPYRLRTN
jgi:hypothetical protein